MIPRPRRGSISVVTFPAPPHPQFSRHVVRLNSLRFDRDYNIMRLNIIYIIYTSNNNTVDVFHLWFYSHDIANVYSVYYTRKTIYFDRPFLLRPYAPQPDVCSYTVNIAFGWMLYNNNNKFISIKQVYKQIIIIL